MSLGSAAGALPGDPLAPADLADRPESWPVATREVTLDTGRVISVRRDEVSPPDGGDPFVRDVVVHPGAVAIVALDDDDRMLLVGQYRHPTGHRLLEPPAGLLDVEDEDPLAAAKRELYEEGHVQAADWRVLLDGFTSPGCTIESVRLYLARELRPAQGERYAGVHEESLMSAGWAPLSAVVDGLLAGRLHNPLLAMGALAVWAARKGEGYDALRPADAPWPARVTAR